MPAPVFSKVPVLLMMPDAVADPVPPIMAAVVRVMAPDATTAVPLLFTNDPLIVKSSAVLNPFKSTKAFNAMVVDAVVPKASVLPNFNVPALTVLAPLYVFTPDRVQVPAPDLVNVPVPLMIPEAVASPEPPNMAAVERVMAPEVVEAETLLFIKDPLIVKGTAVVNPFKSTVELLPMIVAAVVPKALLLPNIKRPLPMFVIPL